MVETVIVTVICDSREFDMELPANVKLAQLKPVLSEGLKRKGVMLSDDFQFIVNETNLRESDTLLKAGVWDGSYITIA